MEFDSSTEPNRHIQVEDGSSEDYNPVEEGSGGSVQDDEKRQHETLEDYQLTREIVRRAIREPPRHNDYLFLAILSYHNLAFNEPKSYNKVISSQLSRNW